MIDLDFCASSYLTFRYVVKPGIGWKEEVVPKYPDVGKQGKYKVTTPDEILRRLREIVSTECSSSGTGILLSSGIDSAILAALLPEDTVAYTVRFVAPHAIDESKTAAKYAKHLGIEHHVVDVTWDDYDSSMDHLMLAKGAPLHAAEAGLYRAALAARNDGIEMLVVGNGADSTFGGMDKLLSRDWTFEEFVARYTFVDPTRVLKNPVSMIETYERYRKNGGFDVQGFLKVVHGIGIIQMFENAIHCGGCKISAPFEELSLGVPLDLARIRSGESKYLLRRVFKTLYPGFEIPEKIPFARPMNDWMKGYSETHRPEFLDDLDLSELNGEQKWLIYNLERFLDLIGV